MVIINSLEDYNSFLSDIDNKNIVIFPTFSDHEKHYLNNNLSLFYIRIWNTNNEYVIGFGHPDLYAFSTDILKHMNPSKIYTTNQKYILKYVDSDNIVDLTMLYYLSTNMVYDWNTELLTHLIYYRKFSGYNNLNNIVPMTKHIELHQKNYRNMIEMMNTIDLKMPKSYSIYNKIIYKLESSGIKVDKNLLKKHYPNSIKHINEHGLIFPYYNFYTSTGRPSNSFGNINFAAINKNDGSRKAFIPKNDYFILFDFDSFHLNLIGKLIGYKFSEKNIHTYLGKYYYKKDKLTAEEYEEAKRKNFYYLYNGIPKKVREDIPFFKQVHDFVYNIWNDMNINGMFKSLLTDRYIKMDHIDDPNATKIFNYLIQLTETETNIVIIKRLLDYLSDKETNLVLYTYDSFLFDYSGNDGKTCIDNIRKILDIFPNKISFGKNYGDLVEVNK